MPVTILRNFIKLNKTKFGSLFFIKIFYLRGTIINLLYSSISKFNIKRFSY